VKFETSFPPPGDIIVSVRCSVIWSLHLSVCPTIFLEHNLKVFFLLFLLLGFTSHQHCVVCGSYANFPALLLVEQTAGHVGRLALSVRQWLVHCSVRLEMDFIEKTCTGKIPQNFLSYMYYPLLFKLFVQNIARNEYLRYRFETFLFIMRNFFPEHNI
jgi:hypothetical protein